VVLLSRRRVLADQATDALLVLGAVLFEQVVCLSLSWGFGIGIVEEILHAEQDLFDRNRWLPRFLLVEDRQANSSRGVDVGMEEWRDELAYGLSI
jgi:hypothetical protein